MEDKGIILERERAKKNEEIEEKETKKDDDTTGGHHTNRLKRGLFHSLFRGDDFDKDYFNLVSYESGEGMRVGKNKLTEASKIFSIEFPDFMGDKGEGAVKDMKKGSYDNEDARSKRGK